MTIWHDDNGFKNKEIIIQDWANNVLFKGPFYSVKVDDILDVNRCTICIDKDDARPCEACNGTGYLGDFEVFWVDESDKHDCNVYEYINY